MPTSDKESQNGEDKKYNLYTERIAPNPWKRIRRLIIKVLRIIASAALFGTVAAMFFVLFSSVNEKINNEDESESTTISFTLDEYEADVVEEEEDTQPIEDIVQNAIDERKLTKDDLSSIYDSLKELANDKMNSIVTVVSVVNEVDWFDNYYEKSGNTSGVIIAKDDNNIMILTNYDAILEADNLRVMLASGNMVEATLLKGDISTNLAVISIPLVELNVADIDKIDIADLGNSYIVEQGEPLIAIGNIFGYHNTMNYGIATAVRNVVQETDASYRLINTSIACERDGTGALINLDGQLVGIVTSKYNSDTSSNLITAYSLSDLKVLMQQLSNNRDVTYLGIYGQSVTQAMQTSNGFPKGVYVTSTEPDSPAFVSGIQSGDIVTGINGAKVTSIKEYQQLLYSYSPGDVIMVSAMRLGREGYIGIEFQCTLGVK